MKDLTKSIKRESILNTNSDATAMRLFILLAFMLMSCSGVFGQNTATANNGAATGEKEIIMSAELAGNTSATSEMQLAIWFMSSKQVNNASETSTNSSTNTTAKKQFINCGMVPNRVLSRTLLKKAMSYENSVV